MRARVSWAQALLLLCLPALAGAGETARLHHLLRFLRKNMLKDPASRKLTLHAGADCLDSYLVLQARRAPRPHGNARDVARYRNCPCAPV